MKCLLLLSLVGAASACGRPPPAPEQLDELMAWTFAHASDEDPRPLEDACENLSAWLELHLAETLEGYEVFDLDAAAVAALGDEPELERLVGASVGHESPYPADGLGGINAIPVGTDLAAPPAPGTGRHYLTDPFCFLDRSCDRLESEEWAIDDQLPLGITATVHWNQDWRWVEIENGTAMIQRFWIDEPIDFNVSFLSVDYQYFLWVYLPNADGTSRSAQATWISAALVDAPVPEGFALSLVVDVMSANADNLDVRYTDTVIPGSAP